MAQRLDRVQSGGFEGREIAENHSHRGGKQESDDYDSRIEDERHAQETGQPKGPGKSEANTD
jgi:hypothetical protein